MQNFKDKGDLRYIYQSEPEKLCSQRDMTHEDFKDFPRRTTFDKVTADKTFNIP